MDNTSDNTTTKTDNEQANNTNFKKTNRTTKQKVGSIISWLILGAVFCLLFYVLGCRITNNVPTFFGTSVHIVVTPSMEPQIKVGDVVVAKKCKIADVKIEDVVLFKYNDSIIEGYSKDGINVVHRVINIDDTDPNNIILTTHGDNNPDSQQETVTADMLLGVVKSHSTSAGKVLKVLLNGYTVIFLIILTVLAYIMFKQIQNIRRELKLQKSLSEQEVKNQLLEELKSLNKLPKDKTQDDTEDTTDHTID